jgi:hypothetical protein
VLSTPVSPIADSRVGRAGPGMLDGMQAAAQDEIRIPHRFGGLLRQRNFRLLWIGESVSGIGNAMAVVGIPLLAVTVLRASTFAWPR